MVESSRLAPLASAMSSLQLTCPAAARCALTGRRTGGPRAARRGVARVVAAAQTNATQGVLDCVVVGGGVSGLCIAQALDTKHGAAARRLLVTEARERVGGNITTVTARHRPLCATRCARGAALQHVCLIAASRKHARAPASTPFAADCDVN
jgi:hypothetical protein